MKLTVTNTTATTGGGVGNALSVTSKDIDDATATLRLQLQPDVDAWLKQQVTTDDVMGKPLTTDVLVNPPVAGQIADNGAFPLTLKLSVTVLVVRSAVLQSASIAQLNGALRKDKNYANYAVAVDANHGVKIAQDQIKVTGDTTSLALSFPASGKVIPKMSIEQIQSWIAGKSVKDAQTTLTTDIPGIQDVEVKISPDFVSFVPWWVGHIHVNLVPGAAPTTPTVQK